MISAIRRLKNRLMRKPKPAVVPSPVQWPRGGGSGVRAGSTGTSSSISEPPLLAYHNPANPIGFYSSPAAEPVESRSHCSSSSSSHHSSSSSDYSSGWSGSDSSSSSCSGSSSDSSSSSSSSYD